MVCMHKTQEEAKGYERNRVGMKVPTATLPVLCLLWGSMPAPAASVDKPQGGSCHWGEGACTKVCNVLKVQN